MLGRLSNPSPTLSFAIRSTCIRPWSSHRPFDPSPSHSDTAPSAAAPSAEPSPPSRRRRQRPSFDHLDQVPSFHVFQQRVQIRSLYRQYLRLIAPLDPTQRIELLTQIQGEFRRNESEETLSHWEVQRALSDGSRRLKELGAMLGTVVTKVAPVMDENDDAQHEVPHQPWPWQRES